MDGPNDAPESDAQFGVWLAWDRERTEIIARGESREHAGLAAAVIHGRLDVVYEYLPFVERDPSVGTLISIIKYIFEHSTQNDSQGDPSEWELSEFSRN